jgi:hypothetical protein
MTGILLAEIGPLDSGCMLTHASNMAAILYVCRSHLVSFTRENREASFQVCCIDGLELTALARANQPLQDM